jgi:hypothetical protein
MKTKNILPVVLLTIIAMLGSSLGYVLVQKHRVSKFWEQAYITLNVEYYHDLQRGDVDEVKQLSGAKAIVQSEGYERLYGHGSDTKFAQTLAEAKAIKTEWDATKGASK